MADGGGPLARLAARLAGRRAAERGPRVHHFQPGESVDLPSVLAAGDREAAHHLVRYLWALEVVSERPGVRSLLDVACGSGYGTNLLASSLPSASVVGADADPLAVRAARAAYRRPNLSFHTSDLMRWERTIGAASYDVVVSFDTLEHVRHRELMLKSLAEHLAPGGAVLLSTPCASWETEPRPAWRAHRIEYGAPDLFDLLSRYFGTILRPCAGTLPHVEAFEPLAPAGMPYVLWMNPVVLSDPIRVACPFRREP